MTTPTALDRIISYKRAEVQALLAQAPLADWRARAEASTAAPPRGFIAAIRAAHAGDRNALICELKRRSPSAGDILPGADPLAIAREYETGGAACLSVLTDGPSFGGSLADLAAVRAAVSIPVLRKDFMVHTVQVFEAAITGADAILVIMAALDDDTARELTDTAHAFGLDVLVEVHDAAETERALRLPSPLIGVNNRNLKTMTTDLETTGRLAPMLGPDHILVSESGVRTAADIADLRRHGARTFLIGESLMKSDGREQLVSELSAVGGH